MNDATLVAPPCGSSRGALVVASSKLTRGPMRGKLALHVVQRRHPIDGHMHRVDKQRRRAAMAHLATAQHAIGRFSHSLGAGPIGTILAVTLPLSLPGILSSITTAFAWTRSAFATPQEIGGGRVQTVSTLVWPLGNSAMNLPPASATGSVAGAPHCLHHLLADLGEQGPRTGQGPEYRRWRLTRRAGGHLQGRAGPAQ